MLDSESKFEKVQGIWFDDIDWGVDVSYDKVNEGESAESDCVYLDSSGYAYGCKKVNGLNDGNNQGTAFQRRLGKEKIGLQKNGWGMMVGKVSFVMGLIEMVKGDRSNGGGERFENKWNEWFEEDSSEKSCLKVSEEEGERGSKENHKYEKKKCKWRLRGDKRRSVLSIFKKVFADEKTWAEKSFKKEHMKGLCNGESKWRENNFGSDRKEVMERIKRKFKRAHCNEWKGNYGGGEGEYVKGWSVNGEIKVIEGQVFEFGEGGGGSNTELLAFEKEGNGSDVFKGKEGEGGANGKVTAGDWLKSARWDGKLGDQSCSSVEQWRTRFDSKAGGSSNDCLSSSGSGKEGKISNNWLHDQDWEKIKKKFGFMKKSEENKCQWLMKEPFTGREHKDLRPEHTMVMGFRLEGSFINY
ncbi:hypothetical protein MSUIS_06440 [Mycoplasma suis KI3806]|uniref:Uncharacterized protein n=1 Tax=Mycoplasma suis (strain KI_3806) TaxID=708248 RepID=F0V256_MYCS3|nr:hypothetical protein [Mycoplasma suis]CBZ40737.1 hypothetical protein MSUIS_06440 [Mycoplasma suis KI3806]